MASGLWALKRSPWVFHVNTGACNNCDIEVLACLTPRFDVERFGVKLVGSPRHADAMLVTGPGTMRAAKLLKEVYEQLPEPKIVIAMGACGGGRGVFKSYNIVGPIDTIIPVTAYVPGCPPKPETMIAGIVKALNSI